MAASSPNHKTILSLLIITFSLVLFTSYSLEGSWIEHNNKIYGAKPNDQGPLGGDNGYQDLITKGDYTVRSYESLVDALSKAQPGQVIFIPGDQEIDMTSMVYIHQIKLEIPPGITLASDRGNNGSQGALICSDALKTETMIDAMGDNIRITGLRLKGPNPKRYLDHSKRSFGKGKPGHSYYYLFPVQNGIVCEFNNLTVDNCDISGFGRAGIFLSKGGGHHIHHNYIHHCLHQGLGYGVLHNKSGSMIEYNIFDHNRKSITGTGKSGFEFVVQNNLMRENSTDYCFSKRGNKQEDYFMPGTTLEFSNNTFLYNGICIWARGKAEETGQIFRNWFVNSPPSTAIRWGENTMVFDNAYGDTLVID